MDKYHNVSMELYIGNILLRHAVSVKYTAIRNSYSQLDIVLSEYKGFDINDISIGDTVIYKRGYDNNLTTRFVGKVSYISSTKPYDIRCYDALFDVINDTTKTSEYINMSSDEIIKDIFKGSGINVNFGVLQLTKPLFFSQKEGKINAGFVKRSLLDIFFQDTFQIDMYITWDSLYKPTVNFIDRYSRSHSIPKLYDKNIKFNRSNIQAKTNKKENYQVIGAIYYAGRLGDVESTYTLGNGNIRIPIILRDVSYQDLVDAVTDKYESLTGNVALGNIFIWGDYAVDPSMVLSININGIDIDRAKVEAVTESLEIGIEQNINFDDEDTTGV